MPVASPIGPAEMPVTSQTKVLDHVDTYNTGIACSEDESRARLAPRHLVAGPEGSASQAARRDNKVLSADPNLACTARTDESERVSRPVITGIDAESTVSVGIVLPGPIRWWRFHMWDNGLARPRNSPRFRVKLWADSRREPNTRSPQSESAAHPLDVWGFLRSVLRAEERGALSAEQATFARDCAEAVRDLPREEDWPQPHLGFLYRREPGDGVIYNYDQICMVVWEAHDEGEVGYRPKIHLVVDGVSTSAGIVRELHNAPKSPRWDGYYDPRFEERRAARKNARR